MSKRILLIDSDEAFARGLQSSLESRGLGATVATNSEQGMSLAKSESPDLIVVCVEAQPTNGYMLCTRLKKDDQLKLTPVILTSANATPDSFEKHKKLKTRAEEYLIKPFEPEALLHRIGNLLQIEIPEQASEEAEIVSMEDEPLGLGDLVSEDEPVHLTDSEAAEAHAAHAAAQPPAHHEELETVEVEEVISETPAETHPAASDEDLDMLDAAFDALAPSRPLKAPERTKLDAPRPAPVHEPEHHEQLPELHDRDYIPEMTGPIRSAAHLALEAKARELEEQLVAKDAELESLRTAQAAGRGDSAELRKLKEARNKADKENVKLKEELNEKEKELIELRDQQATLEHQAQTLQDDATKREIAAKALQQRAEALSAAAKKFERELGTAREELKSLAALKSRVAELEKSDGSLAELQKRHAELESELASQRDSHKAQQEELERHQSELERHRAELAAAEEKRTAAEAQLHEHQQAAEQHHARAEELSATSEQHRAAAEAAQNELAQIRERSEKQENALNEARGDHERELIGLREQHANEAGELRTRLDLVQAELQKLHAEHTESSQAAQGELHLAREAAEKAEGELVRAGEASAKLSQELAEAKSSAEKLQAELAAAREAADADRKAAEEQRASHQARHEEARGEIETHKASLAAQKEQLDKLQAAADKLQKELAEAQSATARLHNDLGIAREETQTAQLEVAGAQEQLDQAKSELAAMTGEKHLLAEERDELKRMLEEARAQAAKSERRAIEAYARIKGDEKLREKTKKALQIALQLLDEVPTLPEEKPMAMPPAPPSDSFGDDDEELDIEVEAAPA